MIDREKLTFELSLLKKISEADKKEITVHLIEEKDGLFFFDREQLSETDFRKKILEYEETDNILIRVCK